LVARLAQAFLRGMHGAGMAAVDARLAAGLGLPTVASGLPVIQVDARALQAHEAYLDGLDKAAGKPCLSFV
jgi:beta-glucosidase-like glycosyl hydrolase